MTEHTSSGGELPPGPRGAAGIPGGKSLPPEGERPRIAPLDPAVVAKIAAGEMILRPVSVAKELIENALDAGARHVEIAVGDRADQSLTVADDGIGMTPEELSVALEAHATSKLRSEEDLLRVSSLGFRGEALPSIGRVSRMQIVTAPADGEAASIDVEGGRRGPVGPAARSRGTTVRVEDLFFNSPVRKRFLKSPASEMRLLGRLVEALALAFPDVGFRLLHRSTPILDLPPVEGLLDRTIQIHGGTYVERLLPLERVRPGFVLRGLLGVPELARPGTQHQTILVNRRWVQTPWVAAALRQAFGDLLPPNRHPFAIVLLELDPARVDVNVHPTKREVRFLDEAVLFGELVRAARAQTEQLVPTWSLEPGDRGGGFAGAGVGGSVGAGAGPGSGTGGSRQAELPWENAGSSGRSDFPAPAGLPWSRPAIGGNEALARAYGPPEMDPARAEISSSGETAAALPDLVREAPAVPASAFLSEGAPSSALRAAESGSVPVPLWQLHRRYVFAQTRQGFLIIDQHAAHERILYEETLARFEGEPPTTQQLLFPATVPLEAEEWEVFQQYRDALPHLGIDGEEFGRQTVLLRGVPALWSHDPSGLFHELLEELTAPLARRTSERMERLAASFACRSAIRSGRSLTLEEMHALVDRLFATRVPHGDPHGRPTFVQIALSDLDRRFGRH